MALNGYTVRSLRPGDITNLINDVRPEDREEWHLAASRCGMGDRTLLDLIATSIQNSAITRVLVHNEGERVLCIWGASKQPGGAGLAWLIATTEGQRRARAAQRHFRKGIEELHHEFPILIAFPWLDNALHIRWMEKLGFKFNGHCTTLRGFGEYVRRVR